MKEDPFTQRDTVAGLSRAGLWLGWRLGLDLQLWPQRRLKQSSVLWAGWEEPVSALRDLIIKRLLIQSVYPHVQFHLYVYFNALLHNLTFKLGR